MGTTRTLRTKLLTVLGAVVVLLVLTKDCHKRLCQPMKFVKPNKHGGLDNDFLTIASLAGTDKVTTHSYHMLYQKYLEPIRHRPLKLLEIGLGCDMNYAPGASQQVSYRQRVPSHNVLFSSYLVLYLYLSWPSSLTIFDGRLALAGMENVFDRVLIFGNRVRCCLRL